MQSGPRGFNASTNLYREAPARTSRAARGEPLLVEAVEEVEQPQAPPSILVHRKRICSHVLVVAVCDFAVTDLAAGSRGSTMPTPRHDGRDRDVELEPAAPVARRRGLDRGRSACRGGARGDGYGEGAKDGDGDRLYQ